MQTMDVGKIIKQLEKKEKEEKRKLNTLYLIMEGGYRRIIKNIKKICNEK